VFSNFAINLWCHPKCEKGWEIYSLHNFFLPRFLQNLRAFNLHKFARQSAMLNERKRMFTKARSGWTSKSDAKAAPSTNSSEQKLNFQNFGFWFKNLAGIMLFQFSYWSLWFAEQKRGFSVIHFSGLKAQKEKNLSQANEEILFFETFFETYWLQIVFFWR
jgi:hypothetical protein